MTDSEKTVRTSINKRHPGTDYEPDRPTTAAAVSTAESASKITGRYRGITFKQAMELRFRETQNREMPPSIKQLEKK